MMALTLAPATLERVLAEKQGSIDFPVRINYTNLQIALAVPKGTFHEIAATARMTYGGRAPDGFRLDLCNVQPLFARLPSRDGASGLWELPDDLAATLDPAEKKALAKKAKGKKETDR